MKRTTDFSADPTPESVHVNGSSRKSPKRKWKPEVERDRSMRAYEQNPRAVRIEEFKAACDLTAAYGSFDAAQQALRAEWDAVSRNRDFYDA